MIAVTTTTIPAALRRFARSFAPSAAMPVSPRIARAIAQYEATSEVIVGWIQMAGVALFAVLYVASYNAFAVHAGVEPAPIALGLYGLFTAWRLRRATKGGVGRGLQYASAFIDIVVLMLMIWSFPLQYQAPAALYLKAPTLAYVFILIALRGLRFDPALVLFTGGLAAIGWAGLSIFAGLDGAAVTGDYRVYMTSLAILPGAELEKIAAILGFTGVLALGVSRTRALLVRTAMEEIAAADLSKFVGSDAAARIRGSQEGIRPGDGELRRAAIMFIDLRGFTPATKDMAPRDVIALLEEYQSLFVPLIVAGGGSVDKFLGDGILVSFGAAVVTGRECADALETAAAIADTAKRWRDERARRNRPPLDIGVAIAAGDIIYGAVGHGERLEFTVIGDAVNLAAKLEKHAKVEQARVIAAKDVWERAVAQGYNGRSPRLSLMASVDGAGGAVDLAILDSTADAAW
jgi:adenylate cyclase